jgi:hypothetical protein
MPEHEYCMASFLFKKLGVVGESDDGTVHVDEELEV